MQQIKNIATFTVVIALLGVTSLFAGNRKTGVNGATFLKIGVGARQVALGSAVTTMSGDPHMMFWNPAGIASEDANWGVAFSHNSWLLSMNHNAVALTHKVSGIGTLGVGLIHIGLSDITANRDIAPTAETKSSQADLATSATYSFYDLALSLTLSRQFTDKLALGASVKLIKEKIDDQSVSAVAGDFGVIYKTGYRDLTLGARMNNLGGDLEYYAYPAPIPLQFSVGASMTLAGEGNSKVIAMLDATKPQDSPQLYFGGLEWQLLDRLSLRGGYKFGLSGTKDAFDIDSTDEGGSFGAGFVLPWSENKLHLDYAFTQFNLLDTTHRFSFFVSF